MEKKESEFQHSLIKELKERFPGAVVLKNDANYIQGIPDLVVLYGDKWGMFECKASSSASHRPNQDYYISSLNKLSFASFISPETKEEVLNELERSFKAGRETRNS